VVCMELSGTSQKTITARDAGFVACTCCTRAWPAGTDACGRCGTRLVSRDTASLQKVWALWLVGLMCYVPANLYTMLHTQQLFSVEESTIVSGAVELAYHGAFGVAAIILIASVLIPLSKFWAIAFLAISVRRHIGVTSKKRMLVYEIVEYIGRWSMIDIFVVAILSALVQLQGLVSITPGPAAFFFALSVVFTMLSAQAFDPRMIWDAQLNDDEAHENV
jgi:paraquat-inducible protein A